MTFTIVHVSDDKLSKMVWHFRLVFNEWNGQAKCTLLQVWSARRATRRHRKWEDKVLWPKRRESEAKPPSIPRDVIFQLKEAAARLVMDAIDQLPKD